LRDQPGKPATFPATDPISWQRFFTPTFSLSCLYDDMCSGTPPVSGGQYSNKDNAYVLADANLGFGKVLVLHGKLPTTPDTRHDARRMGRGQMRYWSLCENEAFTTTKGGACLYDAQVPVDRRGDYTIISSRPADRPGNASTRCGVAFLPWSARCDGDGHRNEELLLLGNMLPAASFNHAVQDVATPGQTAKIMGPYLPTASTQARRSSRSSGAPRGNRGRALGRQRFRSRRDRHRGSRGDDQEGTGSRVADPTGLTRDRAPPASARRRLTRAIDFTNPAPAVAARRREGVHDQAARRTGRSARRSETSCGSPTWPAP
jgi:hypothetical protein